jgi:PAS domain S-box-containing protein
MNNFSQEELEQALRQCEVEPIHQVGKIQPHGALLVLSPDSQRIVLQASTNLDEFFDLYTDTICGERLAELMGDSQAKQIEQLIQGATDNNPVAGEISLSHHQTKLSLQARVFVTENSFVLELMRDVDKYQDKSLTDLLLSLPRSLLILNAEPDTNRYFERVASIVRKLTEFDRVMVYRFDQNWDGEVIAESRVDSAHSYLGIRFPASDIPAQARSLYASNLVRLIADTEATPVSILPVLSPITQRPLNLTHSVLRSLSPVHVEYLRNMGVRASMSISLLQNGRLWGLIICHHKQSKQVPYRLQEASTFISQTVSAKLTLIEVHEHNNMGIEASRIIGKLLKINPDQYKDIQQQLLLDLLALMNATGVIVAIEGKHYVTGVVPDPVAVNELMAWLGSQPMAKLFSCDELAKHYPAASTYADIACGVLAAPLSIDMHNSIVWLRKEKLRSVLWAGNPDKILRNDPSGLHLSPRKSFETWKATWHGRSTSWSKVETETAIFLAIALTEGLAQKFKLEKEQSQKNQIVESLIRSEKRFRNYFELPLIGIAISSVTKGWIEVNQCLRDMLGYSQEELVRLTWVDLTHPDDIAYDVVEFERMLQGKTNNYSLDKRYIHKDGTVIYASISVSCVRDDLGQINYVIALVQDITERKKLENQLAQTTKSLHELIANYDASREAERKAIAREVHDELGQVLSTLRLNIVVSRNRFAKDNPQLMKQLQTMTELVDRSIYGVRNVTENLHPTMLREGIFHALEWLCKEFYLNNDIPCEFILNGTHEELDEARTIGLFRIVQESMTNVLKHADARSISVEITHEAGYLYVEVNDDGKGFDIKIAQQQTSYGLLGMRERARAMGGKLDITSMPGRGTSISIRIPVSLSEDNK